MLSHNAGLPYEHPLDQRTEFKVPFFNYWYFFFLGCSKESLDNVASNGSARGSVKKRLGVTWRYLRWMSDHGRNESITKLLKDHNQLVPPKANARTGADGAVTMGGNEGDDDGPGPAIVSLVKSSVLIMILGAVVLPGESTFRLPSMDSNLRFR